MNRAISIFALVGAAGAVSAWAAEQVPVSPAAVVVGDVNRRPISGPLDAASIAGIQKAGRAVLAAKRRQQMSAEELVLFNELRGLSDDLNQVIKQGFQDAPLPATEGASESSRKVAQEDAGRDLLMRRLSRLHEKRLAVERAPERGDAGARQNQRGARMQHLTRDAGNIEKSIQSALALPTEQRQAKLAELSQRFTPKSQGELMRERHLLLPVGSTDLNEVGPMPTLTTLTEHRPDPAMSQARKR